MKKTIILCVFLFSSCMRPQFDDSIRTFSTACSYEITFQRCVDYCSTNSYPITGADKSIGFINTGYKDYQVDFMTHSNLKVNFNLKKIADDSTRVIVTIYVKFRDQDLTITDEDTYKKLIAEIKKCSVK